jgi:hypothetical protein
VKILPVPAELLHAGRQTHRQTDRQKEGRAERQKKRHEEANILFSQLYEHAYGGNIFVNILQQYTKHSKKSR